MSQASSVSARRRYGLALVCRVWGVARSTMYARRSREAAGDSQPCPKKRRGPAGACADEELVRRIRNVIADSPWVGEGYRKIWARLRFRGVRTAPRRVLRVMREHGLLVSRGAQHERGPRAHDRSITPDRPDVLWGTDATSVLADEGQATIFFVIDHCTAECLGIHAARRGTRVEALEALRQAVRSRFGGFEAGIAPDGLALRHDHGSQFVSHMFQDELSLLGIRSSPAFVREPEGNGCAERFVRTLKEQLLWLRPFSTVTELQDALQAFKEGYNNTWMIQRHGYVPPRAHYERLVGTAA